MGQVFDYDDGQARAGARRFEHTGSDLTSLANSLRSELSGDSPWTQDKIGSAFADKFDPDRSTVIDNVKKFAEQVDGVAPKLTEMSDTIMSTQNTPDTKR